MDDSDDDDNCYYGTPLEEIDPDDRRPTKAPRIEDQVVCDKQGRRRFHGAFTGGFSAGYFNSVGTKEGWTPSTFVSSRSQRMDSKMAKPQDFMDDEDLAAHGISPQGIQATSNFDDSEHKKRKRVLDPNEPIPGVPVLEEILRPNKETMGMKLLRKLGWKPGQGIGPRVKLDQKRLAQKEIRRTYGCQLPQDNEEADMSDEEYGTDVTYAPDDVETVNLATPKTNLFCLGYKPLDSTPVLGGHINLFDPSPLSMTEKKKKLLIKGQAFGVGAFEDEDEDIYATEDMSNYDFGNEKSSKKEAPKQPVSHMTLMGLVEILEGFSLSSQRHHNPKIYPKPTLPGDFVPKHKSRRRRFELKDGEKQGLGRHDMTSKHRARIIADRSQTTVEVRLGVKGVVPKEETKSSSKSQTDGSEIDKLYEEFKNTDARLKSDFKPFAKNEEKQKRYELYLRMKDKGHKERYYLAQPKTMTEWEKVREQQEFERAEKLFRPLSSTMATRFVSAVSEDKGPGLKDGLNVDIPKVEEKSASDKIDVLGGNVADDRVKAAKMNMFGKLTQTVVDWYPDRLLCRRFNVPHPFPNSNFVGVRGARKEKFSIFSFLGESKNPNAKQEAESPEKPSSPESKEDSHDEEVEEKPQTFGLKVPVDGPPTMDLFKAIFQDTDSESDNEENGNEGKLSQNNSSSKRSVSVEKSSYRSQNKEILDVGDSPESDEEDSQNKTSVNSSLDNFLSNMRKGHEGSNRSREELDAKHNQQKKRVSRFEPTKDASGSVTESMPKPVFRPRKMPQPSAEPEVKPTAQGIFANIDFNLLNSYRISAPTDTKEENDDRSDEVEIFEVDRKSMSDSSVVTEDEYGPPVPIHLKNRQQEIKKLSSPCISVDHKSKYEDSSKWTVRDEKQKSHKKHRQEDKHKKKKEKKKKKHKEKKHKRKSSKKHRRKSDSSSSSSSDD